jgi:hypothetical protein
MAEMESMPASEWRRLGSLKRALVNPKDHHLSGIVESLQRFGFVERVIINRRTDRMVAGHGRLDALESLRVGGRQRPSGIEQDGEDWMVPVDYIDVPEEEETAVGIALNRLVELGGWNEPALVKTLIELAGGKAAEGLAGTGFDAEDLNRLVAIVGPDTVPFEPPSGTPETPPSTDPKAFVVAVVFVSFKDENTFERGLTALTFGERNVQRQDSKYAQLDGELYLKRWELAAGIESPPEAPDDGTAMDDDDEDIRPRFLREGQPG